MRSYYARLGTTLLIAGILSVSSSMLYAGNGAGNGNGGGDRQRSRDDSCALESIANCYATIDGNGQCRRDGSGDGDGGNGQCRRDGSGDGDGNGDRQRKRDDSCTLESIANCYATIDGNGQCRRDGSGDGDGGGDRQRKRDDSCTA